MSQSDFLRKYALYQSSSAESLTRSIDALLRDNSRQYNRRWKCVSSLAASRCQHLTERMECRDTGEASTLTLKGESMRAMLTLVASGTALASSSIPAERLTRATGRKENSRAKRAAFGHLVWRQIWEMGHRCTTMTVTLEGRQRRQCAV